MLVDFFQASSTRLLQRLSRYVKVLHYALYQVADERQTLFFKARGEDADHDDDILFEQIRAVLVAEDLLQPADDRLDEILVRVLAKDLHALADAHHRGIELVKLAKRYAQFCVELLLFFRDGLFVHNYKR